MIIQSLFPPALAGWGRMIARSSAARSGEILVSKESAIACVLRASADGRRAPPFASYS